MDIKNLETFVMVNELKSFTQAAQRLGFTQSTVSFQIKQLENELGIPLFERISHTVTLTNEGQKLLPLAHQILRLWAEAGHIAGNTAPAGIVRIAIAESLSSWQFHSHFKDFHDRYPGIRLKLIAASTDDMFQMLGQTGQYPFCHQSPPSTCERKKSGYREITRLSTSSDRKKYELSRDSG